MFDLISGILIRQFHRSKSSATSHNPEPGISFSLNIKSHCHKKWLYSKSSSDDRSSYFTTNTSRSEVVQCQCDHSPHKQHKSYSSTKSVNLSPPVELGPFRRHKSKDYVSIPETIRKGALFHCVEDMMDSKTESELLASSAGIFIRRCKSHTCVDTVFQICSPHSNDNVWKSHLTSCHLYGLREWPRVRLIFLDVIRSFKLDAILKDTPRGYAKAFGKGQLVVFDVIDVLMSYTLMSLVHSPLFLNPWKEFKFFQDLGRSPQRTMFLMNHIDTEYKTYIDSRSPTRSPDIGIREKVDRALPQAVECPMYGTPATSTIIRHYTKGHLIFGDDGYRIDWYKSAATRVRLECKKDIDFVEELMKELAILDFNGKVGTPQYQVIKERIREGSLLYKVYATSADECF